MKTTAPLSLGPRLTSTYPLRPSLFVSLAGVVRSSGPSRVEGGGRTCGGPKPSVISERLMVASRCFIIFSKCKFVQGPRLSLSLSLTLSRIRPEAEGVLIKLGTLPRITTDEVDGAGCGWKEGTRRVQE